MEMVQKRMEVMSGELNQMRRMQLLDNDDCKKILKIRKQYEYKINGISQNLRDFQEYIDYEMSLLKLLRQRRNERKIGGKMGDIEHKIINRIKDLYEIILRKFPNDTTLWLSYFKFCKQAGYVNAATVAISKMIKNHSASEEIWQVAAKWHAYSRKDIGTATNILCKGLAKHKRSKLLYTEAIQLEIHNAVGSNWQPKDEVMTDQQKLCVGKLQAYVTEISNHINDCEYYVELLKYMEKYIFTETVQNTIIEYLVKNHSSRAITWNVLAQRHRKQLPKSIDKESLDNTTTENNNNKLSETKQKLTNCIETYKQGLTQVPDSEKEHLWSLYINCLVDAKQEDGVANIFKSNVLKEAFEQASEDGYLFENYYKQWLELVDDNSKVSILEKGVKKFPQSIELWKLYLEMEILADNRVGIEKVFQQGVKALQEKALPIWLIAILYHLINSPNDVIEEIYKEGVKQPQEVSDVIKPQYLVWLSDCRDIVYTRQQYLAMANEKPYCKELHNAMSRLELTEVEYNFAHLDNVHKLACEQFGKEDVEVWLNMIQYLVEFKGVVSTDVIRQVYMDAKNALPEVLFLDFNDKYLVMTNK